MGRFFILLICCIVTACTAQTSKINGVSFVAAPTPINATHIDPVVAVHANWAAVMPFGFVKDLSSPTIVYNTERQWWGERIDGAQKTIELLHKKGIKVMLKPQIWVWRGEFTGDIRMASETQWQQLESSYAQFILAYAQLAETLKVPVLCIGTELHTFVQQRSDFWQQLIKRIRTIYTGQLTYAENWDQIAKVPFWQQLDYIGVDAYFPIADDQTPTIAALTEGWTPYKQRLQQLQQTHQRPIVFTEYGYRSVDHTAKAPWDASHVEGSVNVQAQVNALQAVHDVFWDESWFAGGFLWKWFHNHTSVGGADDNRFTVQNKPAEALLKKLYAHD